MYAMCVSWSLKRASDPLQLAVREGSALPDAGVGSSLGPLQERPRFRTVEPSFQPSLFFFSFFSFLRIKDLEFLVVYLIQAYCNIARLLSHNILSF